MRKVEIEDNPDKDQAAEGQAAEEQAAGEQPAADVSGTPPEESPAPAAPARRPSGAANSIAWLAFLLAVVALAADDGGGRSVFAHGAGNRARLSRNDHDPLGSDHRLDDLQGLRFRTAGLASEMCSKLGMAVQAMGGGDMFQALQSGTIDAGEFIGPWTDSALGFYQVAKNYYWPGVGEPSSAEECAVNAEVFNALPDDLKGSLPTVEEIEAELGDIDASKEE